MATGNTDKQSLTLWVVKIDVLGYANFYSDCTRSFATISVCFFISYMSAHVLLNLLNKLRKRDKMRGLTRFFRNSFNKFNSTRAQMFDSIYHMTLRLLSNLISGVKRLRFCHYVRMLWTSVHNVT